MDICILERETLSKKSFLDSILGSLVIEVLKDEGEKGAKCCPIYFYFGKYGIYDIYLVRGKVIETTGFRNQVLSNDSSNEFGNWIERIVVHRIREAGFKHELVYSRITKLNRHEINVTCWDFKNPHKFVGRKDVSVLSASSGEPVLFRDLWDQEDEGIAVVALLRHFGCPCCWELASVLKESKPRFDASGVKLIAVGVGTPNKARLLAERLPFPLDCLYADPDRKAYDLLGLYYGFARTFLNPASTKVFSSSRFESLKKAVKNYTIEATPDDRSGVLQQGGMFVFKGKQLLFARKDEGTGDHASLDEILNICCKVPVA
ncbi:thioredoxin-like protein AAED1, chloroplastic [Asparagus officinalis]|uniref:thioredoxin-like protein AAED1, chloroplastic n=1 Tax=Asparagus officinalis TaxID=4686 RepID=UPI00098E1273|nr:thioredoxin-like protein AAED1, chloroplastic [Asparagus officinalis]